MDWLRIDIGMTWIGDGLTLDWLIGDGLADWCGIGGVVTGSELCESKKLHYHVKGTNQVWSARVPCLQTFVYSQSLSVGNW